MALDTNPKSLDPSELLAHAGWVRALAARLVLDPDHVDDVVQDVWHAALRQRKAPAVSLRAWLTGVVRNVAAMAHRSASRRACRESQCGRPEGQPSTAELAERAELQAKLAHLVGRLPEGFRDVVLLRFFEDLPPRKIAARLEIPVNTVRSRLARALSTLRVQLDEDSGERKKWGLAMLPMLRRGDLGKAGIVAGPPAIAALALAALQSRAVQPALVAGAVLAVSIGTWLAFSESRQGMTQGVRYEQPQPLPERQPVVLRTEVTQSAPDQPEAVQPARFRGRVVDRVGDPVEGEPIAMFRLAPDTLMPATPGYLPQAAGTPQFVVARTETGSDGRFVIEGEWPPSLFVIAWGRSIRYVTETPTSELEVDVGDLEVTETSGVSGRVVDTRGLPVAGALVRAIDLPAGLIQTYPVWKLIDSKRVIYHERGKTDEALARFWQRVLTLPDTPEEPTMLVRPAWLDELTELIPFVETETDRDGRFTLEGLEIGSTTVIVTSGEHEAFVRGNVQVDPGIIRPTKLIEMTPAHTVTGRIFDVDGTPLVGAEVSVACPARKGSPYHFALPTVRTGDDGRFEVGGVKGDEVYLAVRARPEDPWTIRDVDARLTIRLALPARHRLSFRLVSRLHLPLRTPEVSLVPGHGNLANAQRGLVEALFPRDRLSVSQDALYTLEEVLPGRYTLIVKAPHHAARAVELALTRDVEELYFLEPSAKLHVTVVNREREPVRGARVFARSILPAGPLAGILLDAGTTGSDGSVVIDRVAGTRVAISAVHPDLGMAHRAAAAIDNSEWRLQLTAPGRIAGRLTDADEPQRFTVQMSPIPGERAFEPAVAFATPDDVGQFTRSRLDGALYRVQAMTSLEGVYTREDLVRRLLVDGPVAPVQTVDALASGWIALPTRFPETAAEPEPSPSDEVEDVALVPATLVGTVLLPGGRVAGGAVLELSGSHDGEEVHRTAESDKNGKFRIADVPAGDYLLVTRAAGPSRSRLRVGLRHGETKPVEVRLELGVFVTGRLVKPGTLREIQFIRQDKLGNWLTPDGKFMTSGFQAPRVGLDGLGVLQNALILRPGRYQVTPGGAGVEPARHYRVWVEVADRDRLDLVIPELFRYPVGWLGPGIIRINPKPRHRFPKGPHKKRK